MSTLLTQTLCFWLCSQLSQDFSTVWYQHGWVQTCLKVLETLRALVLGMAEWLQAMSQRHAGLAREHQNTENPGAKSCQNTASIPGQDKRSWKSPVSWKSLRSSDRFLIWQVNYFSKSISKPGQNLEDKKYSTKACVTYMNRKSWSGNLCFRYPILFFYC